MRTITTSLFALSVIILTGFFMALLLPLIFVAWLSDWWQTVTGTPHVCDAGTPPPDETTRLEEVTRRDAVRYRSDEWAKAKLREIEDLTSDRGMYD